MHAALKENFGYDQFRPFQEQIVRQVMDGTDTLGVLPTGAGKSLCYQLPSLLLPRPTLVISPLIALMQDQLDGLPPSVYPLATLINSSLDSSEAARRIAGIEAGEYKLIYAAPERLRRQEFLALLQRVRPSLIVVDEAHCVSVWGHDFRPDYLFIKKALEQLHNDEEPPTLLALTATATAEMQEEISKQLGRPLSPVLASVFRPNLQLEVMPCTNAEDKMRRLVTVCMETPGAGIVYANSRDRCEGLAAMLNKKGVAAAHYHAGMERDARTAAQQGFMLGRTRVIVATVAFGMGVDKSNVRFVVHFTLPESLEAYSQEAGRAGRDGKHSRCVLMVAPSDKTNLSRWLRQGEITLPVVRDTYRALKERIGRGVGFVSPEEIQAIVFGPGGMDQQSQTLLRVAISVLERCGLLIRHVDSGSSFRIEIPRAPDGAREAIDELLKARRAHEDRRMADIVGYTETAECRHVAIARHFDEDLEPCVKSCDHCLGIAVQAPRARVAAPTASDVPDIGRVILECCNSLPYPLGRTGLPKVLTAASDSPVAPDRCKQFGTLEGATLKSVRDHIDSLVDRGLLTLDRTGEYPLLRITSEGRAALRTGEEILRNPLRSASARTHARSSAKQSSVPSDQAVESNEDSDDRFERLRAWRRIEAERVKLPPFVIFHDSTLRAIATIFPPDLSTLEFIPGIGPRKLENYGAAILAVLHGEAAEP